MLMKTVYNLPLSILRSHRRIDRLGIDPDGWGYRQYWVTGRDNMTIGWGKLADIGIKNLIILNGEVGDCHLIGSQCHEN